MQKCKKQIPINTLPCAKTLNVYFSHGDALTEVLKPQKVKENDTVLGTYHHGSAFKSNFYYILNKKLLKLLCTMTILVLQILWEIKRGSTKHEGFIVCLEKGHPFGNYVSSKLTLKY